MASGLANGKWGRVPTVLRDHWGLESGRQWAWADAGLGRPGSEDVQCADAEGGQNWRRERPPLVSSSCLTQGSIPSILSTS